MHLASTARFILHPTHTVKLCLATRTRIITPYLGHRTNHVLGQDHALIPLRSYIREEGYGFDQRVFVFADQPNMFGSDGILILEPAHFGLRRGGRDQR